MLILINMIFLSIIIYNLIKRRQNIFKANIPKTSIIAATLLLLVGFIIWYLKDKSVLGFITSLNGSIYFLSYFSAMGINEKHINSFMTNSIVILSVPYSEINNIIVMKGQKSLNLKIKAHGHEFLQQYNLELEKEILQFIKSRLDPNTLTIKE